jgi:flagellin
MSYGSINTNMGAIIALQNLRATEQELGVTQNRINTGKIVASAKDNGAVYGIAQAQRADMVGYNAVKQSLQRGMSTIDVAISASETISDLLIQLKEKAISASDRSLDSTSRAALNEDFKALRDQITKTITNATFNGASLISSSATNFYGLANPDNTSLLTARTENLTLGSSILVLDATASLGTYTQSSNFLTSVETSINNLNASLARLGTASKAFELHYNFVGKLQDTIETGIGNLVDADLSKESAKLQSLQTKQQLGLQALSIANQAPQSILSLFR